MERQEQEPEKAAASPRGRLAAEQSWEQSWEEEEGLWRRVAQGEGWEAANAAIEALSLDERVAGWSLPREGKSADAVLQASSLAVGACALCLPAACRYLRAACTLYVRCMCTACALHASPSSWALANRPADWSNVDHTYKEKLAYAAAMQGAAGSASAKGAAVEVPPRRSQAATEEAGVAGVAGVAG
eukprot:scaffold31034_cov63-Phaeocystis_antarctica.AAC.1